MAQRERLQGMKFHIGHRKARSADPVKQCRELAGWELDSCDYQLFALTVQM